MVLIYHVPWLAGVGVESTPAIRPLKSMDCGVGIFFGLSAFLLSRQLWRQLIAGSFNQGTFEKFLVRRFCRIFPAYLLVVALTLLPDNRTWTFWGAINFIAHLLAVQTNFHINFLWHINNVLWTISVEVQFYLILCAVFWLAGRLAPKRDPHFLVTLLAILVAFCAASSIFGLCVRSIAWALPSPIFGGGDLSSDVYTWNVFYFLKWFAPGVFAGWLSCTLSYEPRWREYPSILVESLFVVVLAGIVTLINVTSEGEWRTISPWGWPLNAVLYSAVIYLAPISRLGTLIFGNPILVSAGVISYGIYLWHYPLIRAIGAGSLREAFDGIALIVVVTVVGLLTTCLVSHLCFRLVEAPMVKLGHKTPSFKALARSVSRRVWPERSATA